MSYPPEVDRLHAALESLPGLTEASSGIESLQGITGNHLRFPDFAHLPHGALRRTDGGLEGEALIQTEFRIERSERGWRTLEFLAWFIRDQARSGELIQLRPFALPPMAGGEVQIGNTLHWQIDLFCPDTGEDLSPQLERVARIAEALETAVSLYGHLISADA